MGHKAIQENGTRKRRKRKKKKERTAYKLREAISSPCVLYIHGRTTSSLTLLETEVQEGRALEAKLESISGLPWGQTTGKDVSVG